MNLLISFYFLGVVASARVTRRQTGQQLEESLWYVISNHCKNCWMASLTVLGKKTEFTDGLLASASTKLGVPVTFTHRNATWLSTRIGWKDEKLYPAWDRQEARASGEGVCFVVIAAAADDIGSYTDSTTEDTLRWSVDSRVVLLAEAGTRVACNLRVNQQKYHEVLVRCATAYSAVHVLVLLVHSAGCQRGRAGGVVLMKRRFHKKEALKVLPISGYDPESTFTGTQHYWNLGGINLVMTMFPNYPTAIPVEAKLQPVCRDELDIDPIPPDPHVKKVKYSGMDMEVVKALRTYLNFAAQVRLPRNRPEHGVALPGGGATGALADVLSGASAAAMTPRMLAHMGTSDAVFLTPVVGRSRVCVVVPRAPLLPFYKTALRVFTVEVWVTIAGCYVASALCWHVFRRIYTSAQGRAPRWSDSLRQVLKLFVNLPYSSLPSYKRVSSQLFSASCLIFSIIVLSAYQGSLVKILTRPEYSPDIDTLQELDESGVSIGVTGSLLSTAFADVDSAVWKSLASKTMVAPAYYIKKGLFEDRNLAVIPEYLPVEDNYDNEGRIHVVGECLATRGTAYVVHRQSPYRQQFEKVIARLVAGGLLDHWHDLTVGSLRYPCPQNEGVAAGLTMADLKMPFYTLCAGLILSTVCFSVETIYKLLRRGASAQKTTTRTVNVRNLHSERGWDVTGNSWPVE